MVITNLIYFVDSARRWLTEANKIHSYSASELTSEPWLVGVRAESWFRKLIGLTVSLDDIRRASSDDLLKR